MTTKLVSTYAERNLGLNLTEMDYDDFLTNDGHFLTKNDYASKDEFLVFAVNSIGT